MKKLLYLFIIEIILCLAVATSYSQCVTVSALDFESATQPPYSYFDCQPHITLQPGYVVYRFEWRLNKVLQTGPNYYTANITLQGGVNLVEVTVFARDTITLDSCKGSYSNIFQSTGGEGYGWFEVTSVNGLTVDFMGHFVGSSSFPFYIEYGDGAKDTAWFSPYFTHTYATPGDYEVTFTILTNSTNYPVSVSSRKVHVANGVSNLMYIGVTQNTFCDSIQHIPYSTPPFDYGNCMRVTDYTFTSSSVTNQVPFNYTYDVPGQDVFHFMLHDSAFNPSMTDYYRVADIGSCGIVPDTISGFIYEDTDADGIHDAGEPPLPNVLIGPYDDMIDWWPNYMDTTDASGYYEFAVPHRRLALKISWVTGYLTNGNLNFFYNTSTMHPNNNFLFAPAKVYIEGRSFIDYNNDSVYNAGDAPIHNTQIEAKEVNTGFTYHRSTNSSGNYEFYIPSGTYTVKALSGLIDGCTITPDSFTVSAVTGTFSNKDFALYTTLPGGNLTIYGHDSSQPRPGFPYSLSANVYNSGIDTAQGTVVIAYDPLLTYDTLSPGNGVVNTGAHTITWQTGNVAPGQYKNYNAYFTVPVATPLGTLLSSSATVTTNAGYTDHDTTNNAVNINSVVVGSFDPNDKQVTPDGTGVGGNVSLTDRLHYRINFQNTGTITAFTVVVQDSISANLDMSTFLMEGYKPTAPTVTINNRIATWRFNNINLPDSNSNEPGSHGYIEYSIKPLAGLPGGTVIDNTADIYFDFNSPVTTNTTQTTVGVVGLDESPANTNTIFLHPNPAKNTVTVFYQAAVTSFSVSVMDVLGHVVIDKTTYNNARAVINVTALSAGVYFVVVEGDGVREVKKLVKQ